MLVAGGAVYVVHAVSVADACRWWRCVRGSRCLCCRCLSLVALCTWYTLFLLQVLVVGGVVFIVRRKKSAASSEQLNNGFLELASTYENRS